MFIQLSRALMMIPIQTSTISSLVPLGRLIEARVSAGFPSPADDYAEAPLSLDELTNLRAPSVFMIIVTGDSLIDIGVYDQDILVVDRSLQAMPSDVVIALVQGSFTAKILSSAKGLPVLKAANPRYPDIHICEGDELEIWGVATHALHVLRRR